MKRLTQRLSQLDAASTKLDVIEDQGILEIDQANHKLQSGPDPHEGPSNSSLPRETKPQKVELNYLKNPSPTPFLP